MLNVAAVVGTALIALWTEPVAAPVTTTGYCWHAPCVNAVAAKGITASGTVVAVGVCASEWRVIPKGSVWFIPGYGLCRVEDTGRLVKGRHLDLYFDNIADARKWGRKKLYIRRVTMLENPGTVGEWAINQFGRPTPLAVLRRMCDEVLEGMEVCVVGNEATRTMFKAFRMGLDHLDNYAHTERAQLQLSTLIAEEIADANIVSFHAMAILGHDSAREITNKMEINRRRKWKSNGDGTGQHVDEDIIKNSIDQEEETFGEY